MALWAALAYRAKLAIAFSAMMAPASCVNDRRRPVRAERRRTVANCCPQQLHRGRAENRILHADGHEALANPILRPEITCPAGKGRALGIGLARHEVRETPQAAL
jgi:hypothetical protein